MPDPSGERGRDVTPSEHDGADQHDRPDTEGTDEPGDQWRDDHRHAEIETSDERIV